MNNLDKKYYQKEILLPIVDKEGNIIGKEERWKIHKRGILHRAFTVILTHKQWIIAQFRKHIVFDGYFDFSFSSHPYYKNEKLIDDKESILESLKREWIVKNIPEKKDIKFLGKIFYKAEDNKGFLESEIDYFYKIELKEIPSMNPQFAYGLCLIEKKNFIKAKIHPIKKSLLAPWIKPIFAQKDIITNI